MVDICLFEHNCSILGGISVFIRSRRLLQKEKHGNRAIEIWLVIDKTNLWQLKVKEDLQKLELMKYLYFEIEKIKSKNIKIRVQIV